MQNLIDACFKDRPKFGSEREAFLWVEHWGPAIARDPAALTALAIRLGGEDAADAALGDDPDVVAPLLVSLEVQ